MSQRVREELLPRWRQRYANRGREGKSRLIDELVEDFGYSRKHAIKLLNARAVLAQIAGSTMNLSCRSYLRALGQSNLRADARWVLRGALQSHPQAPGGGYIVKESCLPVVLADGQIRSPIPVIVSHGDRPLVSPCSESRFVAIERLDLTLAIPQQDQSMP